MTPDELDIIATELAGHFGDGQTLPRITERHPAFSLEDGYAVAHRIRDRRIANGEVTVGRKIGGTNPATYHLTGATGPAWNFMYDSGVHQPPDGVGTFSLGRFTQSRIEPEIALRLSHAPQAGMDEHELIGCVDRVASSYEFVFSPYSNWQVRPPDATAAYGLHQGLLLGPWYDISGERERWLDLLRTVEMTLTGSDGTVRRGVGANALGSPILALRAICEDIYLHPEWTPLAPGEIITTGTLTELMPAHPGDTWTTTIAGAPLAGLSVTLKA